MAENVGGIFYTVDADAAPLMASTAKVDKQLNMLQSSMAQTDKSSAKMATQLTKTSVAVNQAKGNFGAMRGAVQGLGYQVQDIAVQLQMGTNAFVVLGQQGSQIAGMFGPGGAVIGAFLAIGAAVGTALLPSLFDSKDAAKELEEALKVMGDTTMTTGTGVVTLSEKIQRLASVSREAALAEVALGMAQSQKVITETTNSVSKLGDEFNGFFSFLGGNVSSTIGGASAQLQALESRGVDAAAAIKDLGGSYAGNVAGINQLTDVTGELSSAFGITSTQSIGLLKLLGEVQKTKSPESIKALASGVAVLAEDTGFSNEKLIQFNATIQQGASQIRTAEQAMALLKSALTDLNGELINAASNSDAMAQSMADANQAITGMAQSLAVATLQSQGLDREAVQLAARMNLGDQAFTALGDTAAELAGHMFDLREEMKSNSTAMSESEAAAKRAQQAYQAVENQIGNMADQLSIATLRYQGQNEQAAILESQMRLGASATKAQREEIARLASETFALSEAEKARQKSKQVDQQFQQLQGELDPLARIAQEEQAKLDLINQYRQMNLDSQINFKAMEDAVIAESELKRQALAEQTFRKQSELNEFMFSTLDALGSAGTNAMSGLLTGTMSAQDAMRSLASTILNQAISALVGMGIQQVKNMIMGQTAGAAATAATIAQAGAITAAMAVPAALTSLATSGANAIPAQAGITATIGTTKALSLAGGRQYGGPVSAGGMYRINENGAPEIYQASNGRQYMMPNSRGEVISNRDATSGGGAQVSVIVNNNAGADVQTTSSDDGRTIEIAVNRAVNEVAGQISGNRGPVWSSMRNSTNVTGRTT